MSVNNETYGRVKEITDRLEAGMKDLFVTEKYLTYLQTMSKFHNYSTRNTLLIHMQMPGATQVAGYLSWKNEFERYVKRGEKGIRILAPSPITIKKEKNKLDTDTNAPLIGSDGRIITEEVEVRIPKFKTVPVFDVSQTEGKPLPQLVDDLIGDVRQYKAFMGALKRVSPLPIGFEPLDADNDGICYYGVKIVIRQEMSEVQTISAVIHEIAHAKLHDIDALQEQDETIKPKDQMTKEVEAESVSYAVCQYYSIETGANSFGYLAEWSRSRELTVLKSSLDTIRKTAAALIDGINEKFKEIINEHGIDLTIETMTGETTHTGTLGTEQEAVLSAGEPEQALEAMGTVEETEPYCPAYEEVLPDPSIGLSERDLYGYTGTDILPLLKDRALELFDQDHAIYMLYVDGMESIVFEREEISEHDGIFGMEAGEWMGSREYASMVKALGNDEVSREAALIYGSNNSFGIPSVVLQNMENKRSAPVVSELEAQVKAGKQISLSDLSRAVKVERNETFLCAENMRRNGEKTEKNTTDSKGKPSILSRLHENKKAILQGKEILKNAPKRNSTMEV